MTFFNIWILRSFSFVFRSSALSVIDGEGIRSYWVALESLMAFLTKAKNNI
jgi:hypothetical protein